MQRHKTRIGFTSNQLHEQGCELRKVFTAPTTSCKTIPDWIC